MKYSSLSRNANKAYTIERNRVLLFSTSALKKVLRNWKRERANAKERLTTRTHWQKYVCAVLPNLSHVMRFRGCYWLLWEKIRQKEQPHACGDVFRLCLSCPVFPAQILALFGCGVSEENSRARTERKCSSAVLIMCISIILSSTKDCLQTEVAEG